MKRGNIVPDNSRYIPLTQQPYCCVPTCFQMVMYKNKIPLVPAEEIGYYLGLVVPVDMGKYFYNTRTSNIKPKAGYGTRIGLPEFEPNKAFEALGISLHFRDRLASRIADYRQLVEILEEIEKDNSDALICFNYGALIGDNNKDYGHVVVFDRLVNGQIRIIDPELSAKWQLIDPELMFNSISVHGDERSGGIWLIAKT